MVLLNAGGFDEADEADENDEIDEIDEVDEVDEDQLLDDDFELWPPGRRPRVALYRRVVERRGGIVAAREFAEEGIDADHLRILRDFGSLRRIRKGWYCHPALPTVNVIAWSIGGPLACVSALVHHGVLTEDEILASEGLHVRIPAHGSPRIRDSALERLAANLGERSLGAPPTLHWDAPERSSDRTSVDLETALEQARHCRPLLARLARERLNALSASDDAHGAPPARPAPLSP